MATMYETSSNSNDPYTSSYQPVQPMRRMSDRYEERQDVRLESSPARVEQQSAGSANFFRQSWEECLIQLTSYMKRHNLRASRPRDVEGRFICHWVQVQRQLRREGQLSEDQIRQLDAIGFEWGQPTRKLTTRDRKMYDEKWQQSFNMLAAFKEQFGHCDVPPSYSDNDRLARWVSAQRTAQRYGRLSAIRYERLTELGFIWEKASRRRNLAAVFGRPDPDEMTATPVAPLAVAQPQIGTPVAPAEHVEAEMSADTNETPTIEANLHESLTNVG